MNIPKMAGKLRRQAKLPRMAMPRMRKKLAAEMRHLAKRTAKAARNKRAAMAKKARSYRLKIVKNEATYAPLDVGFDLSSTSTEP